MINLVTQKKHDNEVEAANQLLLSKLQNALREKLVKKKENKELQR